MHTSPGNFFEPTRWSVVLQAGQVGSAAAEEALAILCKTYWPPLYAYVRRMGHSPEDAQDLVQEFFARLLEKNYLATVEPAQGRFRSFLLMALKRFMANEWRRANRQKRGGGQILISLDARDSEDRALVVVSHAETPETSFERRWALKLLEEVLGQLESEFAKSGKQRIFHRLKGFLTADKGEVSHADLAKELQMTVGAVKVTVHRMRLRYRDLLREEISNTVASSSEIDEELRHLFTVLS